MTDQLDQLTVEVNQLAAKSDPAKSGRQKPPVKKPPAKSGRQQKSDQVPRADILVPWTGAVRDVHEI